MLTKSVKIQGNLRFSFKAVQFCSLLPMTRPKKIYLDVCCYNRPFDDWSQSRIRLEAEAILTIINFCQIGKWMLVSSTVIESEIAQTPNLIKRQQLEESLTLASSKVSVTPEMLNRARDLTKLSFKPFDSLHLACAEFAKVDILLTTDDRLLKKAVNHQNIVKVQVDNPVKWLMKINTEED